MRFAKHFLIILALISFCTFSSQAKAVGFIRDEEIEQMLRQMSTPIFEAAGIPTEQVRFIIVNQDDLNAFVAGGHNIFLNTGLILESEDASQLLGVIAHETGHIASGHLLRLSEEHSTLSLNTIIAHLLGAVIAVGTGSAEAGVAVSQLGGHAAVRNLLRHNRAQEGAADNAGVRFLKAAGMSSKGLLEFMRKLESQELLPSSQQSEYVRTHPLTQDRISYLQHIVDNETKSTLPEEINIMYERMRQKLLGYLYPERALISKSNKFAHRYAKAIALYRKGKWRESLPIVDSLLQEEPENAYLHELKGQILYEGGKVEESLPYYKKAVEKAPFSGLIRVGYAYSLIASNQNIDTKLTEAIEQLQVAIKKEPRMAEPHHLLAIAYGKQGEKGLSSLHLAEKALKQGDLSFAKQAAGRAETMIEKDTPAYLRVKDILAFIDRVESKKRKK